ncbi:MAG: hypothetical protein ACPL4H_05360 [Anaerolineales bacterium]
MSESLVRIIMAFPPQSIPINGDEVLIAEAQYSTQLVEEGTDSPSPLWGRIKVGGL